MMHLIQPLTHTLRAMRKSPGVTAAAVLALALGIGANTAIFSVVDSILLNPAALRELRNPESLVMLWEKMPGMTMPPFVDRMPVAAANVEEWREQARTLESVTAFQFFDCNIGARSSPPSDRPERMQAITVEPGFFETAGIRPAVGRVFTADEARNSADRVVMVSDELWRSRFGGGAALSGRTIRVDGVDRVIVGVMPPRFRMPAMWEGFEQKSPQIWIPVDITATQSEQARWGLSWFVYGRLKPGVTLDQARAELGVLFARVKKAHRDQEAGTGVNVFRLADENTGPDMRTAVLTLQAAVGFVLLIACANVANLLLARAAGRQRELAIRMALGAERARIIRLILVESVVLSGMGAAAGLVFAWWGLAGLSALAPKDSPGFRDVHVNVAVLAFTVLLSLVAALISGLAPALQAVRQNINATLSQGGRSVGSGARWVRNGIVIAQVALALVLLAGAGLMIRSLNAMMHVDLGYRVDHLLTTRVSVADPALAASPEKLRAFDDAILNAVQHLPGALSASISSGLPMADFTEGNYNIEGQPKTREIRLASQSRASEDFFSTLGMPIMRGRSFTRAEAEAPEPAVVVVSDAFARKNWPGTDALGKVVLLPNGDKPDVRLIVVGITNDTHQMGPDHEPVPALFVPSHVYETFDLALRTAGDPAAMAPAVEKAIWSVDRQQPVQDMLSMQKRLHDWADERRFYMAIMALFAGLALTLAVLGLYGVLAYIVSLQTREMGVRMALGATRADLITLVVGQSAKLTLAGVAIGSAGALLVTRLMRSMVFGITTTDPVTFVAAAAALMLTALAASYAPARRAARVDPMQALRNE